MRKGLATQEKAPPRHLTEKMNRTLNLWGGVCAGCHCQEMSEQLTNFVVMCYNEAVEVCMCVCVHAYTCARVLCVCECVSVCM